MAERHRFLYMLLVALARSSSDFRSCELRHFSQNGSMARHVYS